MSNPDQLQTIDLAALAQVSGGAVAAPTSGNDEIFTALSGILDSIQSLAGQHNNGGGFNQQDMLLMMMMMQRNQQPVTVSTSSSPPWQADPIIRYY